METKDAKKMRGDKIQIGVTELQSSFVKPH